MAGVEEQLAQRGGPDHRRTVGRGTEDEVVIARRLARAAVEMAASGEFDVIIENHDVHEVCERLVALVRSDEDDSTPPTDL